LTRGEWSQTGAPAPARLHLRLPLEPSRLLRARERVRDYLDQQPLEPDVIDDVVLALEEAMTNAVRHSGADDDLDVGLCFGGSDLLVEVKDRGRGFELERFDSQRLPDPQASGGRGLFLMANLMDDMELTVDGGLGVRMAMRGVLSERPLGREFDGALTPSSATGAPSHRKTRLRAMLEEISEGFAALDWEYRHVHVNRAACRLVGLSAKEVLGCTPFELWPELLGSELEDAYRAAMELGRPSIVEYQTSAGDWFEARLYPTAAGLSVYFREIGERKRRESELDALLAELRENRKDLDRAQAVAHSGSWRLDTRQRILRWSDEVYPMFGLPVGTPLTYEMFLACVHPDDRSYVDREWTAALHGAPYDIEHRILVGGTVKWVREQAELEFDAEGALLGGFGSVTDITERKRATAERQAVIEELEARSSQLAERVRLSESLETVNQALHSTLEFDAIMQRSLDEGIKALRLEAGSIELREQDAWLVRYQRGFGPAHLGARLTDAEAPIAARALRSRGPLALTDTSADPVASTGFLHAQGFVSVLCVPLLIRKEVIGCLLLHGRSPRVFSAAEIDFAGKLGATVSLTLGSAQLYERESQAARLGSALTASLPFRGAHWLRSHPWVVFFAALALQAAYLVPLSAAGQTRQILGIPSSLLAVTAVIAGALAGPLIGSLTAALGGGLFFLTVAQLGTRSSVAAVAISTAMWVAAALFSGLLARGLRDQAERRRAASVALAQAEAARQAQLAELSELQRVATTLQENFIHPLPELAGWEFAVASRPASAAELIGGDFHDVFAASDDHLVILLGDVEGKGISAAGMTETVHVATRALAVSSPSPNHVLERLNRLLLLQESVLVTALFAVLHRHSGMLSIGSAGHPAPLHLRRDGSVEPLQLSPGLPLGAFEDGRYAMIAAQLEPGEALLLYTDGVIDARREGVFFGEESLLTTARRLARQPAQEIANGVCDVVTDYADGLRDDVKVLVVRRDAG
jgi:PAS domain S-box-containing protein